MSRFGTLWLSSLTLSSSKVYFSVVCFVVVVVVVVVLLIQNRERELDDNFRLMVKKDEIAEKSRNVKMLRDQLRSLGVEAYDQ